MTEALIHGALGLGVMLVVPLALRLDRRRPSTVQHFTFALAAGSFAGLSIILADEGVLPAAVAAPWLVFTVFLALRHLFPIQPRALLRDATEVLPFAYLVTGAGWLLISRYGGRPLDFSDTIVELTAVHFHYAGFVAPVLMLRLVAWLHAHGRDDRGARLSLFAVLAATPLTAAGITFEPALGAMGAVLFAAGLTVSGVLTLRFVVPQVDVSGKVLLATSSLSVIAALGLAVAYALGQWLGTPAPSLPVMVRTHGLLNAVGFGLAGVLGWLAEGKAAERQEHGGARRDDSRPRRITGVSGEGGAMARTSKVTGSLIVVLLAGVAVAEAATTRKGTARVVRETYAPNPYETIVVDYADPGLSITTVDFTPRSGEDRVMVTLTDDSGDPVRGTVYQRSLTNERFCGQTDEPVAVNPSAELSIEVFAGPCGGSTSVPTEGTVEVKFLRSGAR